MRRRSILGAVITGYDQWVLNIEVTSSTIANTGGTVTITPSATRTVYWSDRSTTIEYGVPTLSVSSGTLQGRTLTLDANTSTSVKTITITASYEGVTKQLNITQAGKTIVSYTDWSVTVSATPASGISAAGGTSTITRNAQRTATWTDNSTTTETATPTLSTNLGTISGNTLTLEPNQTTSAKTATITATHSGKSATCTVSQNADSVSSYGNVNLTVGTIADVPASGGSSTSTGSSATQTLTWVSGRTTTVYPTITEGTISNVASKGTTTSDRTSLGTVTITASGQGSKSASKTLTVYQQANQPSYGAVSVSSNGSASDIPAKGGDRTASGGSGTQTVTYTSGATRAGTVTCGSYSKVSANSLGTTEKTRTHIGNSTATLTGEGSKTASVSVAVYQAANVKTLSSISAWASYSSNKTSNGQNDWIAAGGGYIDAYCQANYSYTSESTSTANVTSSTTWTSQGNYGSISGNRFTVDSRGTTAGADRYNYIYASYGGKSASFNTGNQKNEVTNSNYNPYISAYGTPSVSIGSGITAGGGSATVSHSVNNTQTYYQLYTSGSTTTHTRSVAGTTTIKIQSNGNSRFSLSGNTLSHSSMGTTATTDTCTIRATNSGDTSKVKDASTSATNAITSYGSVSVTSNGSASDIPAKGGTVKGSGGSGSQTITYTSGSTRAGTVTCGTYSDVSANSLGTTEKTRTHVGNSTATLTGEGSKTATARVAVYQAANTRSVTSIYLVPYQPDSTWITTVTNGNWNTVPASGGYLKSYGYYRYTYTSTSTKDELVTSDASLSWNTGYNSWITAHVNGGYYVANRTTTVGDARSATGTWSAAGFTATKTFTQAANAVTNTSYGSWSYNWTTSNNSTRSRSITYTYTSGSTSNSTGSETGGTRYIVLDSFSDGVSESGTHSFGAAGGSITARTVSHEYWGSTYITSNVITGVSVSCTGFTCSVSGSTVTMSASNLGTTVTAAKSATITSTKSGFQTRSVGTLSQAANAITSYGAVSVSSHGSASDIPAKGGTIYASGGKGTQTITYTSGKTRAGTVTCGSYSGVSANSLTTTLKDRTKIGNSTATLTGEGSKTASVSVAVYQQANTRSATSTSGGGTTYGNVTAGTITNATVPASGGTKTATAGNGSQTWSKAKIDTTYTYTSGSTKTETTTAATSGTNSVAPSVSSISATGSNLGTTIQAQTTLKSQAVTWSANGKSASGTMYVYQQANSRSATSTSGGTTTYGNVTAGTITNATVPASGGTKTATAGNGSQTWSKTKIDTTYTYTSGSTKTETTTAASSGTNSVAPSVSSISATGSNLGTTIQAQTTLKSQAVTWSANGKSASGTMYVYQQANSRSATSTSGGTTTYGNVTAGTITNKTIPASGGSATATAGNGSQTWSKSAVVTKYTYTSGSTKDETTTAASSGTNTISPSVSSYTASASSKGTTESGVTTVGSKAVTWSGSGSKSASGTMYIYQQANSSTSSGTWEIFTINDCNNVPYTGQYNMGNTFTDCNIKTVHGYVIKNGNYYWCAWKCKLYELITPAYVYTSTYTSGESKKTSWIDPSSYQSYFGQRLGLSSSCLNVVTSWQWYLDGCSIYTGGNSPDHQYNMTSGITVYLDNCMDSYKVENFVNQMCWDSQYNTAIPNLLVIGNSFINSAIIQVELINGTNGTSTIITRKIDLYITAVVPTENP